MNVCVTVNSKYERYLYIMLVSLYETHPQGSINLFVIQRDFTLEDKQDITELSHKYLNHVTYIKADPHKFDGLRMSQKGRDNLSLEIYFRLLMPEFIPASVDRVLMLDVDIVVLRDLRELYNTDFSDCYLVAATNMCHNGMIPEGWRKWYGVERKKFTHYNTGILLWNLKEIREKLPREYIFKEAWNHSIDVATFEEELFNVLFGESGILEVPAEKYNYICTHEDVFDIPNFKIYKTNEEVKKNVSIVHYAALNPWQGGIKNDKFKIWWEICKKTKYYHQILEETYETAEIYLKKRIAQDQDEARCKINELTNKLELESKKLQYIDLLLEEDSRRKIADKLRKLGWNRFVVYGASRIARCLTNLFKDIEADILCYVDKNYQGAFLGKDCVRIEQIKQYESLADCIIVSNPYYYDEIVSDVRKYTELMILSVDDLLGECEPFPELVECGKIIDRNDNWFILGKRESYKRQEDLLAKYGIYARGSITLDEFDSVEKNAKFIIIDKNHIKLEHWLLEKGLKHNRDFIVLSHVFVGGYDFTNTAKVIENFDNGGDKSGLKGYFCSLPFTQLYYYELMADICSPTWNNNTSVGNPQKLSIEELWNSPKAQEIRRSILDETFEFCNTDICWRILEGKLERRDEVKDPVMRNIIKNNITVIPGGPEFINIAYNPVCNLYCRMCRDERIVQMDEKHKNKTISDLKNYKFFNLKRLIIPGSGELFANKDYIELLQNINEEQFPKLEAIWIYSNGVLFNERNWNKISHLSSRYKIKVFISTDSVCKETFTKIRRGGDYASFKDNLKTVRELRHRGEISKLYFAFCVQRMNFREMSEFVSFAHENGADSVHFEKLFHAPISECVHRPENVYYDDFVCELKKTIGKGRKLGIEVEVKPFMDIVRRNHLA